MKYVTLLFFLLFSFYFSSAQDYSYGSSLASGETGIVTSSPFNAINNQALASLNQSTSVAVAMQNYYLLEKLNQYVMAGNYAFNNQSIGGGIIYYGDANYNETEAQINYARNLTNEISIGGAVHYFNANAVATESASTLLPSLTLAYLINPALTLGFKAVNLLQQELEQPFEQQLESLYSLGMHYNTQNSLDIALQLDLGSQTNFSLGTGLQYQVINNLEIAIGFRTTPGLVSAGISYSPSGQIISGIGSTYHNDLGLSPHAYLGYQSTN